MALNPSIIAARSEIQAIVNQYGFDWDAAKRYRQCFRSQRARAVQRKDANGNPIQFNLTINAWLDIWIASGKLSQRRTKRGQYVMARHNDMGNYEIGNVFIVLQHVNNRDAHIDLKMAESEKQRRSKAFTGLGNPNVKEIIVDGVRYPMMKAAAEATGLSYWQLRKLLNK